MFDDFDHFDQAFAKSPPSGTQGATPLRRRKSLKETITFWCCNVLLMPLVALVYLTIGAEGLRQSMGIFSLRIYKLPVPGAGLMRQYDGWDRLDLSMLMALILFGAATFIWMRIFKELQGFGTVAGQQSQNPILFFLLLAIAAIIVLGDSAIFYIGLKSQVAGSWGSTPEYVPAAATLIYMAGLALIGAWHADFHSSRYV